MAYAGPRRSPYEASLAAFLAQTPASQGGVPQTAPPAMPEGDPMAQAPAVSAPMAAPQMNQRGAPGGDPFQSAMVASAQLQARRGPRFPRPRTQAPGLSAFLR